MKILTFFNNAGATGHVFFVSNGKRRDKGFAYSGFVFPGTTIAVIPTVPQAYSFAVEVLTLNKQKITVTGNLKIIFNDLEKAVAKFDFTVNKNGSYTNNWQSELTSIVLEQVLGPIQTHAKSKNVSEVVTEFKEFETSVMDSVNSKKTEDVSDQSETETSSVFGLKGIKVESCSIVKITASDDDVAEALGVKEREELLAIADKAQHDRQKKASENARALKKYDAETAQEMEDEKTKLIEKQSVNKKAEATSDAAATEIRLNALEKVDPGKILGAAIMEAAKNGNLTDIALTTEFLSLIKNK